MSYLRSFKIVIFYFFLVSILYLFYPSEILASEELTVEEISIHTKQPVLITDRAQNQFTDDFADLDSLNDQSFQDNSNGQDGNPASQSGPITWRPGRFYIRTGPQNAANQGLVDVYDSMGLAYYKLTGIDLNRTRVFYFRGHSYSDDDFVLGSSIHPGIISRQIYNQLEGSRELFFTLNYWTHYHYAPSIINWHNDDQNEDRVARIDDQLMWIRGYDIRLMGQSLIVNNYKHYGQIRDRSKSGLKTHINIDTEAYQDIYNKVFSDDEIFVVSGNDSNWKYQLKDNYKRNLKFSIPKYYEDGNTKYSLHRNNIGVGEASINLSEARLRSPRLWVEREAKSNHPWLDLSIYNYWSPSKSNKLLIEEYAKFVFEENDYAGLMDRNYTRYKYDNDDQTLGYLHIPSGGVYSTHFAVQSCKELKSSVEVDDQDGEIKTLNSITAYDIIRDLKTMADDPRGVYSTQKAYDSDQALKDFYAEHISKTTFDPAYKDMSIHPLRSTSDSDLGIRREIEEKFSTWWLAYYFILAYQQSLETAQKKAGIENTDLEMPNSGRLSDYQNNTFNDEKMENLIDEFGEQIKSLIVDNFDSNPFLATLIKYVLYYKDPSGRVKSCNDLKQEIYKSFYIKDDDSRGQLISSGLALDKFLGDSENGLNFPNRRADFRIDQSHVTNIKNEIVGFRHYSHKWWEHTNIDFSCKLLKTLLDRFSYGIDISEVMLFIEPLLQVSNESPKSSSVSSKHYSTALRKDHFPTFLTSESFNWEELLKKFGNKIDGDDHKCEGSKAEMQTTTGIVTEPVLDDNGDPQVDENGNEVTRDQEEERQVLVQINQEVDLGNRSSDRDERKREQRCINEHWTKGWKKHKEFYSELAEIFKKVAELDDLQIKLSRSPHHFIDCGPYTEERLEWKNIQSSASLDTVQNFFPDDRTKTRNIKQSIKKRFISKHPEADFALRDDLKQLYKDYNYITFATSLQDTNQSEPDLQPGRPMLVIPGTEFVMPEIFKQEPDQQSVSLFVQAYPRSKVTLQVRGRVVQGNPVNGCGSARIDLGYIPNHHRKRIFDKVREDVARAMTASGLQRQQIVNELHSFILSNRAHVSKIPSRRDILDIVSRCPQTVITFSN